MHAKSELEEIKCSPQTAPGHDGPRQGVLLLPWPLIIWGLVVWSARGLGKTVVHHFEWTPRKAAQSANQFPPLVVQTGSVSDSICIAKTECKDRYKEEKMILGQQGKSDAWCLSQNPQS